MKTLPTTTTLSLLSLLAGACAMGDNTQPGALLAEGAMVPDAAPMVDAPPPREDLDPLAAAYYTVTVSDGLYYPNYDDNGSGPGDPIADNDMQMVWGTLVEGPPTDFIFINMYEGIGSFSLGAGLVRDFGSLELPATIDLTDTPEELNYNTCGLCISILSDITVEDGELTNYDHQLAAVSGTITFDQLPVEPDQTFSATINNIELAEIDLYGEFVEGGRTRFVPRIEFTVVPSSN